MFFRNTAPDRAKLAAGLVPRRGAAAFCCQCSWLSLAPQDAAGAGAGAGAAGAAAGAEAGAGAGLLLVRRGGAAVLPGSAAHERELARSGLTLALGGGGFSAWSCAGHA